MATFWHSSVALLVALLGPFSLFSPSFATAADEQIAYRLKWLINASTAGDVVAEAEGLFAAEGLQVAILPGGPERDAIREVELGRAHFGVASADQVIRGLAKGAPIVVVAQLFQVNPLNWIYRPEQTTISSGDDLRGKVIGVTYGGNDETILRTLLQRHHIGEEEVQLFSVRHDYTPFYQKKVDLWPLYRNAQGVIIGEKLRAAGEAFAFFNPDQAGVRFVANSVITSAKLLAEKPELVQRFTTALRRGWQLAMAPEHAERTAELIHRFDRETPLPLIREQLALTRELVAHPSPADIGRIDLVAWQETEAIMLEQKQIDRPVDIATALHPLAE